MVCSAFFDNIFYHFGEIFHFKHVLFLGDGLYGVIRREGDPILDDDLTGITFGDDRVEALSRDDKRKKNLFSCNFQ